MPNDGIGVHLRISMRRLGSPQLRPFFFGKRIQTPIETIRELRTKLGIKLESFRFQLLGVHK